MDLSVMFFGSDRAGGDHTATYADIVAVTREADRLGFHAVWTPERHFQEVGQVFPNPGLLSAALATVTERIGLRAGSVVLPLHHPLRVVEDWAMIDNLSGGRCGFSVATGWHSRDFVLAPDHYADRRARAEADIATVRALWSGAEITCPDGTGRPTAVRPRPDPVQRELPLWLTSSGSATTWDTAARLRTGVLTTTVGRPRAELAELVRRYRTAYAAAPHQPGAPAAGAGRVTLMAHTYVGVDEATTRARTAEPMRGYLRSHVRQAAADRGAGGDRAAALDDAQVEQLAAFAYERCLRWGSLLGSPEHCRRVLTDLAELGCDEVACFVDFGLDRTEVLESLRRLADIGEDVA